MENFKTVRINAWVTVTPKPNLPEIRKFRHSVFDVLDKYGVKCLRGKRNTMYANDVGIYYDEAKLYLVVDVSIENAPKLLKELGDVPSVEMITVTNYCEN